ncbi:MAG: DUF488 domain-containing protein [Candidatus Omnitrophica bacterium]|nr:DUF488 domain-containing protein [Candidatus Omnitrophota bacterium]
MQTKKPKKERKKKSIKPSGPKKARTIFSIGHSIRTWKEFISVLRNHEIAMVADVRTIPRSRHNPQFNRAILSRRLRAAGLRYCHLDGLGGLRHAKADSVNTAWRNASFRGYADYMQTRGFVKNLQPLIRMAGRQRVVIMCAEAVPWRCHRSLIADALCVRKFEVRHILGINSLKRHTLTPWAKVRGVKVWYPLK